MERLDILLPFREIDQTSSLDGCEQVRQAIGYQLDAMEIPEPPALTIRPALTKIFGIVAHGLVEERTLRINIVVDCDNTGVFLLALRLVEQIRTLDLGLRADQLGDAVLRTAHTTDHDHALGTIL